MSLYPDDIDKINEEHRQYEESKNVSNVAPGLNINHELPQEKEERERQEKEAKANALIETLETRLKSYIDSQLAQIPQLINQNIQAAFQQILPQLQQAWIVTGKQYMILI